MVKQTEINRRGFMAAASAVGVSLVGGPAFAQQGNVTFTSWGGAFQDALRSSMKNMETLLARLLEETQAGRSQLTQDIRNEFRLLARTIAALAEDER